MLQEYMIKQNQWLQDFVETIIPCDNRIKDDIQTLNILRNQCTSDGTRLIERIRFYVPNAMLIITTRNNVPAACKAAKDILNRVGHPQGNAPRTTPMSYHMNVKT